MSKPASQESIQRLYESMSKTIPSSFNLLHDTLYTYSQSEQITEKKKNNTPYALDTYKNLLELYAYLLYGNIVLSVFLRASWRSTTPIEKWFNLKYIVFLTTELYKAINGKKGIWEKIQNAFLSDTVNSYIADIEHKLDQFSRSYCTMNDITYRNLAVHYDENPTKVYDFLGALSEDFEVLRVSSFLGITNAYSALVSQFSLMIFKTDGNAQERFTIENETIFGDTSGKMYSSLGDEIPAMAQRLNSIQQLYSLPKVVKSRLEISSVPEQLSDFLDATHLGMHIHLLYLDIAIAIRAYLSSEFPIEKAIHLARLNLLTYEGVRKIYTKDTDSFWQKYIVERISSKDSTSQRAINDIESLLSFASENGFLFDTEFRHNYAHIRRGRINRLPFLLKRMKQLDAVSELKRPLLLLKVLPGIMRLHVVSLMAVGEKLNTKLQTQQHKIIQDFEVLIDKIPLNKRQKSKLLESMEPIKILINKINNSSS